LEVAPYEGLYWPTSSLATGGGGASVRHHASLIKGARVTLWWRRLGIEGAVGSAPSDLWVSIIPDRTYPAFVRANSVKARLRMTPPAARAALQVGAGVGWVRHCGYAYLPWYTGPWTFTGGIANANAVIKLVRCVGLRFDLEDFLYSSYLGICTRTGGAPGVCLVHDGSPTFGPTRSSLQNDLVLSVGIVA
jgi:hypothetical protein